MLIPKPYCLYFRLQPSEAVFPGVASYDRLRGGHCVGDGAGQTWQLEGAAEWQDRPAPQERPNANVRMSQHRKNDLMLTYV